MTSLASRPALRVLALILLLAVPLAVVGFFAGALSAVGSENAKIPAAIVNEDEMVQQTAADGTETPVLAGRLLVTALTGDDAPDAAANTFDWQITGAKQASAALEKGDVYVVLTIPEDFSASIVSLSSADPTRANISIRTDDAHGYLTGPLTDIVGDGLAALFGDQISEQFIAGLVGGTGQLGTALTDAADGATQLQTGAQSLGAGLGQLTSGITASQQGAQQLTDGLGQYTGGVDSLSSGLDTLAGSSAGLQQLPSGVQGYTAGVAQAGTGLQQILDSDPTINPQTRAALESVVSGLGTLGSGAPAQQLIGAAQGAAAVQSAIGQSAAGAAQLSAGSDGLVSGAQSLTDGLGQLAAGASSSATGANQLADGAGTLASGLTTGAGQVPTYTDDQAARIAEVASSPIGLDTVRSNEVTDIRQIFASLLIPVGVWIGAFAVFLALGGATRRLLASTASSARIGGYLLVRAGLIVAGQAALLTLLLHTALKVPWGSLPVTLPFALLIAVVFTCIHAFLTSAFGRWGLIASFAFLGIQLAATGGLYPIEILSGPVRALSPLLPLTEAVNGMQAIVTASGAGGVVTAALQLAIWAVVTAALAIFAISRRRSARAVGLLPATA